MGKKKRGPRGPKQSGNFEKTKKETRRKVIKEDSDDYLYDDIDKFHLGKDKLLLNPEDDSVESDDVDEEEEEVLPLDIEEREEEEEEDQDVEDSSDDEGNSEILGEVDNELPSKKAWGKKKKIFYDADVQDDDIFASDEEAERAAQEEEEEALALQRRLAEGLHDRDFETVDEADFDDEVIAREEKKDMTVTKDLSQMSKEEKLEILVSESPELPLLIDEFQDKLEEIRSIYGPLFSLLNKPGVFSVEGVKYIKLRYRLLLNYCVNISFYLYLKSKQQNVKSHPVMNRILEHQKSSKAVCLTVFELLRELAPLEKKVRNEADHLLRKQAEKVDNEEIMNDGAAQTQKQPVSQPTQSAGKTHEHPRPDQVTKPKEVTAVDPLEYYNQIKRLAEEVKAAKKNAKRASAMHEESDESMDEDSKRGITYEMAKNKGLTRKRKKELRNPRVKHKVKFKKAIIKRKSQVREVMKELDRYGGEGTGIKANITKSVKIR